MTTPAPASTDTAPTPAEDAAPQGGQAPPSPTPKPGPPKPAEPAGTPADDTGQNKAAEAKTFDEAYVKQLRDEAAKHRTTAAATKAEQDKLAKILADIGKALNPDAEGEQADPAKLTQQLAEREQALTRERVENAAYRAAARAGANPDALLDSRAFLTAVHKLDPTADTFTADLESAIKTAVETNPQLKATGQVPARSVTDTTATRDTTGQLTRADLAGMTPEQIQEARIAGRLTSLLRGSG